MHQPGSGREFSAFLSALSGELSAEPDEITAKRQVAAAAKTARQTRLLRRSQTIRWTAAAVALTTLFGTGGVAIAGSLPAPFQEIAADAARVLPVRLAIPYPTVPTYPVTLEPDGGVDQLSLTDEPQVDPPKSEAEPILELTEEALPEEARPAQEGPSSDDGADRSTGCELPVAQTAIDDLDSEEWQSGDHDGDAWSRNRRGDRSHWGDRDGYETAVDCRDNEHDHWQRGDGEWSDEWHSDGADDRYGDGEEDRHDDHLDDESSDAGRRERGH